MNNYDTLNPMQREAVLTTEGPLLVLAGAGSGKTRALTHRVAYLIEEKGVKPWNILAITFTNKAAGEMRDRVNSLVEYGADSVWVSTFHSLCVRILRRFIENIGYTTDFSIYDSDDTKTLMKQIFKDLEVNTKVLKERGVLGVISSAKNEMISPEEFMLSAKAEGDSRLKRIAELYMEYQKRLKKNNALDFDDLLVKTVELFQSKQEVLEYLLKAVDIGINGYLLKDSESSELKKAILSVVDGEDYIQPSLIPVLNAKMIDRDMDSEKIEKLTKRELEVLKLLAVGMYNKGVADELHISERTVKNHVSSIFKKIDVSDRTQAAVFAIRNNLISIH